MKAGFLSGLAKVQLENEQLNTPWRAKHIFHYIQDKYLAPDFVIDITPYWNNKIESIQAFKTQFYTPGTGGPETYISNPTFLQFIEGRALELGHSIGVKYGEGFIKSKQISVNNLFHLS